jgi:transposase
MFSRRRGQAYSQDLRERVLAADHLSAREAAAQFEVSVSYVVKARQRRDRLGLSTPGPQRSWMTCKLAAYHERIAGHVRLHPDITLAELGTWLADELGVRVSMGTVWNTLRRLGLTLKKSTSKPRNAIARISPRHAVYGRR